MVELYPFQLRAVNELREAFKRYRSVILQVPTGGGKTWISSYIIKRLIANNCKVVFATHREELIEQCSKKLDQNEVAHGVVKSGHWRVQPHRQVQVVSIPTLVNRLVIPEAHLVVVDECHHAPSSTFAKIIELYPKAKILGLSATPFRLDGQGLREWFETIVVGATLRELVDGGWLVRPRIFAPEIPDLTSVKKTAGEFNKRQLGQAMDRPTLIANLVTTYQKYAAGQWFVGFAVTIEHAKHTAERFLAAGIKCAAIYHGMPGDERQRLLRAFESHELDGLWSVNLLSEGYDAPWASCGILARPTASLNLYRQQVGRLIRRYEDPVTKRMKEAAVILDHAGNANRHLPTGDFIDEPVFSLDGVEKKKEEEKSLGYRTCLLCFAISPAGAEVCVECGVPFPIRKRVVIEVAGELREWKQAQKQGIPLEKQAAMLANWIREGREKGHHPAAPFMKYKGMFNMPVDESLKRQALEIADSSLVIMKGVG